MQSFGGRRRPASAYLIAAFCFHPFSPFPLQIFKEPAPERRTNSIIAPFAGNASCKIRKRFLAVFSEIGNMLALARRLRQETTMSLKWIAQRMHVGSWTYVSNLLREK